MTSISAAGRRLDEAFKSLPVRFPGPGGAAAVLKDGKVLEAAAWGYADAEYGVHFTPKTLFRMCSITKQFTCGLLLKRHPEIEKLDADVAARLPRLKSAAPSVRDLCHNQSGLRDYWTLAMIQGAGVEQDFGGREAATVLESIESLQFSPGSRYSYCNQNFRILSDVVEARAEMTFAELLRRDLFDEAGMETAFLAADTRAMPDGATGYEGSSAVGHRAAVNRIVWTGDAGLGASLADMIAWEQWIDRNAQDKASLYAKMSTPTRFADGRPAAYGFGLSRWMDQGRAIVGHGGALRGWRSQRLYCAEERISVVVMLNHLSDASAAAAGLFAAALNAAEAKSPPPAETPHRFLGAYLEPETGVAVRISANPSGGLLVHYGHHPEPVSTLAGDIVASASSDLILTLEAEGVRMSRPRENQSTVLERLPESDGGSFEGVYACPEAQSRLIVEDAGGVLHGAFEGPLGRSRFEALERLGEDVYHLPCRRALDHTPPGEFTLVVARDHAGRAKSVRLGCWLARNLVYERMN